MAIDFNPVAIFKKGVSEVRDLASKAPSVEPAKKLVSRSVDRLRDTVADVVDKVTPDEVPIPRSVDFGGVGRFLKDSPLIDFLGGLGQPSGPKPNGVNTSGSEIPGGTSLYDEGKGMYHKGAPGAPDTYAFENTPEGIKFAAENGYASIDLDMLITKDGVPVATHWAQPMLKDGFHDPLGKLDEKTKISDMTLAEVMRLRNEDGQSQIYPMSTMIEHLKKNGIAGDLEAKNDPRFATDEVMGQLADQVREAGIKANLKSIDRGPQTYDLLETAQEHGFWVRTAAANGNKAREFGYGSEP